MTRIRAAFRAARLVVSNHGGRQLDTAPSSGAWNGESFYMVVGEPDDAADEEAGEDGPSSSSDPTVILVENRYEEFRPRAK